MSIDISIPTGTQVHPTALVDDAAGVVERGVLVDDAAPEPLPLDVLANDVDIDFGDVSIIMRNYLRRAGKRRGGPRGPRGG